MLPNLWILTEERPKSYVIENIIEIVFCKKSFLGFFNQIKIIPILDENNHFTFTYRVIGIDSNQIANTFIKVIKGSSSFVDFMVFLQKEEPMQKDQPFLIIEETKTTDKESRNTGAGQRATKFPYSKIFYPNTNQIMLYSSIKEENKNPTESNQFFTRLLLTYGVEIHGKELKKDIFQPFKTIDELINFKNNMKTPPKGNVPILIERKSKKIQISGRLWKSGSLSHDPNIGQLSIIAAVLRKLGWKDKIEITKHGLEQKNLTAKNKFIHLANLLFIDLEDLNLPKNNLPNKYWEYEMTGEKMVTIFLDLLLEYLSGGLSIYSNHAGAERGYFLTKNNKRITVEKYQDRDAYKKGDKSQIINLPDLVICDDENNQVINIEGEQFKNAYAGIKQIKLFDAFEKFYIKNFYPGMNIFRTVVLFGGDSSGLNNTEVSFILSREGELLISMENSPKIFKNATKNLLDFYDVNES